MKSSGFEEQLFYLISKGYIRGVEHLFRKWQHKKKSGAGYKVKTLLACCGLCKHSPSPVNKTFFHREVTCRYNPVLKLSLPVVEYTGKGSKRVGMQNKCALASIFFVFFTPALCTAYSILDPNVVLEMSPQERFFLWSVVAALVFFGFVLVLSALKSNKPSVTPLHVAIMFGQVNIARSLTAVWLASSKSKDGSGLTPRQLLDKLSGQDSDSRYFHRQLKPEIAAALDSVLKDNEAREKAKQTIKNRLANLVNDDMSEKEESGRYEEMMAKISKREEDSQKIDADSGTKMLRNPLIDGEEQKDKITEMRAGEKVAPKSRVVRRGTGTKSTSPVRRGTGVQAETPLPPTSPEASAVSPGRTKIERGAGAKK